jgi:hypothetical protein
LWSPPSRRASTWRGRGLEGVTQTAFDRALQQCAVEDEADGSAVDAEVALGRQELSCERERIANAQSHDGMELPSEREVQEGRVGDPARHAASCAGDSLDVVLREDVVGPLDGCVDCK